MERSQQVSVMPVVNLLFKSGALCHENNLAEVAY